MNRVSVQLGDYHAHIQGYQGEPLPEYSNAKRHVYFSRPLQKYITARRKGAKMELEFTADCPCTYDH
jgi:hypothetical protein